MAENGVVKKIMEGDDFKKVMNVPFSVIVASFITIIITSKVTDKNGLSALIAGYSGLLLGLFYIIILIILYDPARNDTGGVVKLIKGISPMIVTLGVIVLLIYYLSVYFDKISSGQVSSYYDSFLTLSTIFMAFQMGIISNSIYNKSQNMSGKLISNINFSLLVLFGLVNTLIIITIGVILKYYSTQG